MTEVHASPTGLAEGAAPTSKLKIGPVITVLVISALVMILNETVLSVALPRLMDDFAVTAATAQWLTTGFMLTMAVVIPTTGFLLQRFTTRALFVAALTLFAAGTALAIVAPTFVVILVARVIQAAGTAIILPLLMTTTLTTVPVEHRGAAMGLNSVVISVAPAIGPTISGIIVEALGWRWLFGLMLPVGLIALALGLAFIRPGGETRRTPLDVSSVLLSVIAFGGIVNGLSTVSEVGDGSFTPAISLAIGLVSLAFFTKRQTQLQRTDAALLDLRPFRVGTFTISVVIVMICMATMLGTVVVLPIFLQAGLGISVLATGLVLLPGGLIQGVLSPFIGRVYDLFGPRPLVIPGALFLAGGQWWLSRIDADTSLGLVVAMHVAFCIGMSMLMTPLMTVSLGALPRHLYGHGSAIMNTLQQLAGAAGIALLVAAMTIGASQADGLVAQQVSGTRGAFVLGGCIALLAVLLALFVKRLPAHDLDGAIVIAEAEEMLAETEAALNEEATPEVASRA